MTKSWSDDAWDEYLYWQTVDKKKAAKINELIKNIEREGLSKGLGKPEPLKHGSSAWSHRIDREHRLVYNIVEIEGSQILWIISCKGHYEA